MQRSVARAVRAAGNQKKVSCHTFRHSFATHLLDSGTDIRTVQVLLGHKSVKPTMIYTRVTREKGVGVKSLLDSVGPDLKQPENKPTDGAQVEKTLSTKSLKHKLLKVLNRILT